MQGLDDIAVFIKVIQAGSFTKAARLMGMPNTTVSAKVSSLEERLGVTLIRRTTRKLHITPSGEAYFHKCLAALEEIQAAESELTAKQATPHGLLRITAPIDIGQTLLRPILQEFLKTYPQVTVEVILSNRFVDLVAEGVDLAIRVGHLKDSTLIAKKFLEQPLSLWASPAYIRQRGLPSHPKELKNHDFIRFSAVASFRLKSGKESILIQPPGRLILDDMQTVKSYVMDGLGLGVFPKFICAAEEAKGKLIAVLPKWISGSAPVSFVHPPQRFVAVNTQAFMEVAQRHTP